MTFAMPLKTDLRVNHGTSLRILAIHERTTTTLSLAVPTFCLRSWNITIAKITLGHWNKNIIDSLQLPLWFLGNKVTICTTAENQIMFSFFSIYFLNPFLVSKHKMPPSCTQNIYFKSWASGPVSIPDISCPLLTQRKRRHRWNHW